MPHINVVRISQSEISTTTKRKKNNLTCGRDLIPSFLLKDCGLLLTKPLHTLSNTAISTCTFLLCWKKTHTCPIHKSGAVEDILNYRPIFLLLNRAEVFEIPFFDTICPIVTPIISPYQHEFMQNQSTPSNLSSFTQHIPRNGFPQTSINSSKAFGRINHSILQPKLVAFSFSFNLTNFLKSYFCKELILLRLIVLNHIPLHLHQVSRDDLIWNHFINELALTLRCDYFLFADELKLYLTVINIKGCHKLQNNMQFYWTLLKHL